MAAAQKHLGPTAALFVVGALALSACGGGSANSACAAPGVYPSGAAHAGDELQVFVLAPYGDCFDTGQVRAPAVPLVELDSFGLRRGGVEVRLPARAGDKPGRFVVRLPPKTEPGPATLVAGEYGQAELLVLAAG